MSTKRWWENFESPWFWLKFRSLWLKWRKAFEKSLDKKYTTPVSKKTLDEIDKSVKPKKRQNFNRPR